FSVSFKHALTTSRFHIKLQCRLAALLAFRAQFAVGQNKLSLLGEHTDHAVPRVPPLMRCPGSPYGIFVCPRIVNDESHPIVVLRHRMVSNQEALPFPSNAFEIGYSSRLPCFRRSHGAASDYEMQKSQAK